MSDDGSYDGGDDAWSPGDDLGTSGDLGGDDSGGTTVDGKTDHTFKPNTPGDVPNEAAPPIAYFDSAGVKIDSDSMRVYAGKFRTWSTQFSGISERFGAIKIAPGYFKEATALLSMTTAASGAYNMNFKTMSVQCLTIADWLDIAAQEFEDGEFKNAEDNGTLGALLQRLAAQNQWSTATSAP